MFYVCHVLSLETRVQYFCHSILRQDTENLTIGNPFFMLRFVRLEIKHNGT
jgi:hypothetical protein